ncbi:centromere kinetochore component CENP-T-domain-containing protein [Xylaria sp. CBS 124048]|nr:centromere kinetochore component CENP-T-domain-containing protein [Xylaria sp. CBS 124048]
MANTNPGPTGGRLAALSTPRTIATPNRRGVAGDIAASGRRNKATTPHARAAIRALDQRRAALFTPGRARRQSLREQRETPRDLLRNLSRVLAPISQAVQASSSPESAAADGDSTLPPVAEGDADDLDDDDFPIERPRFSLPLGPEEDDDDIDLKPPRLSGLEEENYTMQSIELPRRVATDHTLRSSLGSIRFSDYMGPDIQSDDAGIDSGFFPPPALDDSGEVVMDEPEVIERLDADEARRQTFGADSIFGAIDIPDVGNETTFVMAPVESPVRDPTMAEPMQPLDEDNDLPLLDMDDDDDDHVNEPMGLPDSDSDGADDTIAGNNASTMDETTLSRVASLAPNKITKRKAGKKISRHGIEYPSLPPSVVKRLATTCAKSAGVGKGKISPDTLGAIMQATDWFFEQLGDDLAAYAGHAGRKTIDESDMITLMRRQRQTSASTTPFALAQRHLPRELLQALRMPVPVLSKASRKKKRHTNAEREEEEIT